MVRIDCKGNVVLAEFDGWRATAVLARPTDRHTPFVVAIGYDEKTGTWSQGRYYESPLEALLSADPDIVYHLSRPVTYEQVGRLMVDAGYTDNQQAVDAVAEELGSGLFYRAARDWNGDVAEVAAAADSMRLNLATDTCGDCEEFFECPDSPSGLGFCRFNVEWYEKGDSPCECSGFCRRES